MINSSFLKDKLKEYSNLTGYNVRQGMPDALAYKLSKANYQEYQISKAIDRLIDRGERLGYSEIIRNIPQAQAQEEEEITPEIKALAKREWAETKDNCVGDFQCSSCRIQYCSLQANILLGKDGSEKGLIVSMVEGETSRARASDILGQFKGINWGLDFKKKETKGLKSFGKKANSFKWEEE